jgi:hypothetical protein
MKETSDYLKQKVVETVDVARLQWVSFAIAVGIFVAIYVSSLLIPPGIVTWLLITPPAVICGITALARLNDIGVECLGQEWQVRRIGLILAGAGAVMMVTGTLLDSNAPTWKMVIFTWGIALTWLTTPLLPPWWQYISGKYRDEDSGYPESPLKKAMNAWDRRGRRRGESDGS